MGLSWKKATEVKIRVLVGWGWEGGCIYFLAKYFELTVKCLTSFGLELGDSIRYLIFWGDFFKVQKMRNKKKEKILTKCCCKLLIIARDDDKDRNCNSDDDDGGWGRGGGSIDDVE